MSKQSLTKLLALLFSFAMIAAACGGDSSSDEEGTGDVTETDDGDGDGGDGDGGDDDPDDDVSSGDVADGDVDTVVEETTGERVYGGTIAVGLEAEAVGLRPWEDSCSSPCYNIMLTIYDTMTAQTVDGNYEPFLLESLEANEDFTVYTGVLRSGITFHNGTELTAQTVADMFPIQQAGTASAGRVSASNLAGVEATGDLEVTYTLSQPNSAFPAFLSRLEVGAVFDPALAASDPDGYNENPIGTGPFVFESRDLDNETIVVRNDNYWMSDPDGNQLPFLDEISFRPIPDEGTRLDATLSGTTQVAQTLRQGTIRDARAAKEGGDAIELVEFQGNNVGGGQFNVLVPPYDDVRVRRGLTHMNSQENVIEALGGTGISLPGTQWFSPDSPWYSEKVAEAWPKFDFELGVSTLQEYIDDPERSDGKAAGEPIDVELSCPPDPTLIAAMQVIEQTWTASGLVNVELTNYDQQTHINYALGAENGFVGEHGAHCWRWSDNDDPSVAINPFLAPPTAEIAEAAGIPEVVSPFNFPNWFDPDSFGAAVAATQTDDFDERYALYESIMLKIAEEVPIWYSGHTATALVIDPSIQGLSGWHLPSGTLGNGTPAAIGQWREVWIAG